MGKKRPKTCENGGDKIGKEHGRRHFAKENKGARI